MLDPQSKHWRYAAGNAFQALETKIRLFDFSACANGHTCSGFKPQDYIDIIDGFLAEDQNVVLGGNRAALQELRKLLVESLIVFDVGAQNAIETWNTDRQRCSLNTQESHVLARKRSPYSGLETEWFIEGFCQSYAQTELESIRDSL